MNSNQWLHRVGRSLVAVMMLSMVATTASAEWEEKVLYSFQGGSDGYQPAGGVVFDRAGKLYGATSYSNLCPGGNLLDCGAVFELSPHQGGWSETTLHDFKGHSQNDGGAPVGGVIVDALGNLYGTTAYGGTGNCVLLGTVVGCGTVYELSPPAQKGGKWKYAILYNFQGGTDALFPWGSLTLDKYGNLFGATQFGGGKGTTCDLYFGGNCGTVFKLRRPTQKGGAWTEKILHRFAGIASGKQYGDGANPNGGLVLDSKGAVYGTTYEGGNGSQNCGDLGCGTAFKLTRPIQKDGTWTETVIHRFNRTSTDGGNPMAGMVFDAGGRLYGTTLNGGPGPGPGTVFRLVPPTASGGWKETILLGFPSDAGDPEASVLLGPNGNLYGTTSAGGYLYAGTVFRLTPPKNGGNWTFDLLYGFEGRPDGGQPAAGLVFDGAGNLYGTTPLGGAGTGC